jgi:hypothetical protein
VLQEVRVPVLQDGFAYQAHQVQLVVDIVHGQEMSSRSLLCCDVVDIGARDVQAPFCRRTAARALAAVFNGRKVLCVDGVAHVQDAGGGDCVAETLRRVWSAECTCCRLQPASGSALATHRRPRGPHAIKHVGAQRD